MSQGNYVVNRDDVCIGRVINTNGVSKYSSKNELHPESFYTCRSIIFVTTEDNKASDLLFESPLYPILNLTDTKTVLKYVKDKKSEYVPIVEGVRNIGPLLKHFGFAGELTLSDIEYIRSVLFSSDYYKEHCEEFGYKKENGNFVKADPTHPMFDYFRTLYLRCDKEFKSGDETTEFEYEDSFMPKQEGTIYPFTR